jgi:hypothetical protein
VPKVNGACTEGGLLLVALDRVSVRLGKDEWSRRGFHAYYAKLRHGRLSVTPLANGEMVELHTGVLVDLVSYFCRVDGEQAGSIDLAGGAVIAHPDDNGTAAGIRECHDVLEQLQPFRCRRRVELPLEVDLGGFRPGFEGLCDEVGHGPVIPVLSWWKERLNH